MSQPKFNMWAELWDIDEFISLQQLLAMHYNWGEKLAYDLGSGAGYDTMSLLQQGWKVTAVDKDPRSFQRLKSLITDKELNRLSFLNVEFSQLYLSPCNLINAKFSLPFCTSKAEFNTVWSSIRNSLTPHGFFCGQLFGVNDSWNGSYPLVFHTLREVKSLIWGFEVVQFLEIEKHAPTLNNGIKYWHLFHLILRKQP